MMANFEEEFAKKCYVLDPAVRDLIKQSRLQYNDATSVLNDKAKVAVEKYNKKALTDTVFSLKTVCDQLFDVVLKVTVDQTNTDVERLANKLQDVMNNRFAELTEKISNKVPSSDTALDLPVSPDVPKEKHVIILKDKDGALKYNEQKWSTIVKGTLESKLKDVPVNRSLLSKTGQGCLFFPNKKAQEEAKSLLEPLFKVTSSSKPAKDVLPKIKVFDINTDVYHDKITLKQAILDKNPAINAYHEKGDTLDIILINDRSNSAILKVSSGIRRILMKSGKIFLGMQSLNIRDHFQPLQCFACQGLGHKQGAEECRHHRKATPGNTCLYCSSDEHRSKDCPFKKQPSKHECVNCKNSDRHEHRENANHTSTSLKCPFIIREVNALIKRTTGINDAEAKKLRI